MSTPTYARYLQSDKGTYIEELIAGSINPEPSGTNYHVYIRENDTLQTSSRIRVGETPNQVDIHPDGITQVFSTTPTGVSCLQPLDMNSKKIVNVLDPTANQDAATKNYVDSAVSGTVSASDDQIITYQAGTLTGDSSLTYDLTNNVLKTADNHTTLGATIGSILGGNFNTISAIGSTCISGSNATSSNNYTITLGGTTPIASGLRGITIGGESPTASGQDSIACGKNSIASGPRSICSGDGNTASGANAVCTGGLGSATNSNCFTSGRENIASGLHSCALGYQTRASNTACFSTGNSSTASGLYSAVIACNGSTASGSVSFAQGSSSLASATNSVAMIRGNVSGDHSAAIGYLAETSGDGSVVLGHVINNDDGSITLGAVRYTSTISNISTTSSGKFHAVAENLGSYDDGHVLHAGPGASLRTCSTKSDTASNTLTWSYSPGTAGNWTSAGAATPITHIAGALNHISGYGFADVEEYTATLTFSGPWLTPISSVNVYEKRIGNWVQMHISPFTAVATIPSTITSGTLTANFYPLIDVAMPIQVLNNSSENVGLLLVKSTGTIEIFYDILEGGFTGVGTTGLKRGCSITYRV